MSKRKTTQDMRALGKLGGRPALGEQVSVSVYATDRGRDVLMLRVGGGLARKMGWRKGTKLLLSLSPDKRVLNVRTADDGTPLRAAVTGHTLTLQQTVTRLLPVFGATRIMPLVIGQRLSIPLKTAFTA